MIPMSAGEMSDVLSVLESQGAVALKQKGKTLTLEVELADARRLIQDAKAVGIIADVEGVVL